MLLRFLLPAALVLPLPAQGPAIGFDRTHAALGRISPGQPQRVVFKVSNSGDAPLQISEVNPSCGCTTTLAGSLLLKPGEGSEIEALLDPQGMKGMIHKSLAVRSNDPRTPTVLLTLEAEVVPEVVASPEELFISGVPRRGLQTASVRFTETGGEGLRILEASSPAAFLTLTPRQEAGAAVLEVVVEGSRLPPAGRSGQEIVTVRTSSARMPTLTVPVYWVQQPAFNVEPAEVGCGTPAAGRRQARKVVLSHAEGRPFRIVGIKMTSNRFQVTVPGGGAAARHALSLSIAKGAPKGSWSEVLLVQVDDPDETMVAVPVRADIH